MQILFRFMVRLALAMLAFQGTAAAPFHVGIVAGSADCQQGAAWLVKTYGEPGAGGMVRLLAQPEDAAIRRDAFITSIVSLADDPEMKAIIVNPARPGTAEAFRRVHATRPDILCLAGESAEETAIIAGAADLVCNWDYVGSSYRLIHAAKQLGAGTFIDISIDRDIPGARPGSRIAVMEAASRELGLRFVRKTLPDPATTEASMQERVPAWLGQYGAAGEKVAMSCANDALAARLQQQLQVSRNGIFLEDDLPYPPMYWSGTLGLDLKDAQGDVSAILKTVEAAIISKGVPSPIDAWGSSYASTATSGLGEYAIRLLAGKARKGCMEDVLASYAKWTPGAAWHSIPCPAHDNVALISMDTCILATGVGLHTLLPPVGKVPEACYGLAWELSAP